jgi:hypothetical protein
MEQKAKNAGKKINYTLDDVNKGISGLSYFRGTACPIVGTLPYKEIAEETIMNVLRDGHSINELKSFFYDTISVMERTLINCCIDEKVLMTGMTTPKNIKKWINEMGKLGYEEERLDGYWYCSVYILLRLKVIENDDMNGMMFMHSK